MYEDVWARTQKAQTCTVMRVIMLVICLLRDAPIFSAKNCFNGVEMAIFMASDCMLVCKAIEMLGDIKLVLLSAKHYVSNDFFIQW